MFRSLFLLNTAVGVVCGTSSSANFQINFPTTLKVEGGYANSEAMFGTPSYGGAITAQMIYAVNDACNGLDGSAGYPTSSDKWEAPFILLIDRGTCTFVAKVREAQRKGAAAVIIADNKCLCSDKSCTSPDGCETVAPVMADDGSGGDISIPALMIFKGDADKVKSAMIKGTTVLATLSWDLPAPDNVVEWDLWTSSIDEDALKFKKEFHTTIRALGSSQAFTPHYYLLNGYRLGCDMSDDCGHQCVRNGRYCLPDPDGDTEAGLTGADIVRENVRQMCIWDQASAADPGVGDKWWSYLEKSSEICGTPELFVEAACREKAMKGVGLDVAKVVACMAADGGLEGDGTNARLEKSLADVSTYGVLILPEVYVNGVHMRGHVSPASVLTTICSGYLQGTEPKVCTCVADDPFETQACVNGGSGGAVKWSAGSVFGLVVLILVAFAGGLFVYWKRSQDDMRNQVRGILAEYMPLDDLGGGGTNGPLLGHANEDF